MLRKRSNPVVHCNGSECGLGGMPELPRDQAVSLPALLEKAPRIGRDLPDRLEPASATKTSIDDRPLDLFHLK